MLCARRLVPLAASPLHPEVLQELTFGVALNTPGVHLADISDPHRSVPVYDITTLADDEADVALSA